MEAIQSISGGDVAAVISMIGKIAAVLVLAIIVVMIAAHLLPPGPFAPCKDCVHKPCQSPAWEARFGAECPMEAVSDACELCPEPVCPYVTGGDCPYSGDGAPVITGTRIPLGRKADMIPPLHGDPATDWRLHGHLGPQS